MVQSSASPAQPVPQLAARVTLSILRTETVLSRFPVHLLTKRGRVTIHIQRTNAHRVSATVWKCTKTGKAKMLRFSRL
jgi:hypothetical protein